MGKKEKKNRIYKRKNEKKRRANLDNIVENCSSFNKKHTKTEGAISHCEAAPFEIWNSNENRFNPSSAAKKVKFVDKP